MQNRIINKRKNIVSKISVRKYILNMKADKYKDRKNNFLVQEILETKRAV